LSQGQLISIVIPTHNRADTLGTALDSVLTQTHTDFEVVIVDDGSTDGTAEWVKSRYGADPRIRHTYQERHGPNGARNTGLAMIEGDYVAFLDSDDYWEPWKLELQLACLRRLPEAGMVFTNMAAVDDEGRVTDPAYLRTMYSAYGVYSDEELFTDSRRLTDLVPELAEVVGDARLFFGHIYPQIVMGNLFQPSTVLLTRKRQKRVGDWDADLKPAGGDHDYHLRTAREGPVCLADVAAVRYRVGRDDAVSRPSQGIHIARNNLKTLDKAVAHDRDRIRLPQSMIDAAYAGVHGWLGDLLLQSADTAGARRHLSRSVWLKPWQPHTAGLLVVACVPAAAGRAIRRVLGWARRGIRRLRRRS